MKKIKTFLLPAIMVLAGAGSAYATHLARQNKSVLPMGYAYHSNEDEPCIPANKECSTEEGITCTANVGSGVETLYDFNGTNCPTKLFERIVQ